MGCQLGVSCVHPQKLGFYSEGCQPGQGVSWFALTRFCGNHPNPTKVHNYRIFGISILDDPADNKPQHLFLQPPLRFLPKLITSTSFIFLSRRFIVQPTFSVLIRFYNVVLESVSLAMMDTDFLPNALLVEPTTIKHALYA